MHDSVPRAGASSQCLVKCSSCSFSSLCDFYRIDTVVMDDLTSSETSYGDSEERQLSETAKSAVLSLGIPPPLVAEYFSSQDSISSSGDLGLPSRPLTDSQPSSTVVSVIEDYAQQQLTQASGASSRTPVSSSSKQFGFSASTSSPFLLNSLPNSHSSTPVVKLRRVGSGLSSASPSTSGSALGSRVSPSSGSRGFDLSRQLELERAGSWAGKKEAQAIEEPIFSRSSRPNSNHQIMLNESEDILDLSGPSAKFDVYLDSSADILCFVCGTHDLGTTSVCCQCLKKYTLIRRLLNDLENTRRQLRQIRSNYHRLAKKRLNSINENSLLIDGISAKRKRKLTISEQYRVRMSRAIRSRKQQLHSCRALLEQCRLDENSGAMKSISELHSQVRSSFSKFHKLQVSFHDASTANHRRNSAADSTSDSFSILHSVKDEKDHHSEEQIQGMMQHKSVIREKLVEVRRSRINALCAYVFPMLGSSSRLQCFLGISSGNMMHSDFFSRSFGEFGELHRYSRIAKFLLSCINVVGRFLHALCSASGVCIPFTISRLDIPTSEWSVFDTKDLTWIPFCQPIEFSSRVQVSHQLPSTQKAPKPAPLSHIPSDDFNINRRNSFQKSTSSSSKPTRRTRSRTVHGASREAAAAASSELASHTGTTALTASSPDELFQFSTRALSLLKTNFIVLCNSIVRQFSRSITPARELHRVPVPDPFVPFFHFFSQVHSLLMKSTS